MEKHCEFILQFPRKKNYFHIYKSRLRYFEWSYSVGAKTGRNADDEMVKAR
jgi:hypothetical protein